MIFDLSEDHAGPYSIIELVSHHNIKSVRTVDDFGKAKWLLSFVYQNGHHRLIKESDWYVYKFESDYRYRAFLAEDKKSDDSQVRGYRRTDPETFPYIYTA